MAHNISFFLVNIKGEILEKSDDVSLPFIPRTGEYINSVGLFKSHKISPDTPLKVEKVIYDRTSNKKIFAKIHLSDPS